jgi:ubiquinone/menaquinone biosynthesis C-methylase UbiE
MEEPTNEASETGWEATRRGEADRIRKAYEARGLRNAGSRYSLTSTANLMAVQERERLLLEQFSRRGWNVADLDCLDVGCGSGGELARLIASGADPTRLHGIDLRDEVIAVAKDRLPACDLVVGDASQLPYSTASMDLVLQFTVLSSILDDEVRRRVAAEMIRMCRPSGVIVSYDFVMNPTNPDTRGLNRREIRRLFPGCAIRIHSVTLAPPIARRIAPRSRRLAALVGALPPLRSHLIAFITPPRATQGIDA